MEDRPKETQTEAEKETGERENFEWRFRQYWNTQVLGIGGRISDNRNLLYGGGRQIDWTKMR